MKLKKKKCTCCKEQRFTKHFIDGEKGCLFCRRKAEKLEARRLIQEERERCEASKYKKCSCCGETKTLLRFDREMSLASCRYEDPDRCNACNRVAPYKTCDTCGKAKTPARFREQNDSVCSICKKEDERELKRKAHQAKRDKFIKEVCKYPLGSTFPDCPRGYKHALNLALAKKNKKACPKCKTIKSLKRDFYKNCIGTCKPCHGEYAANYQNRCVEDMEDNYIGKLLTYRRASVGKGVKFDKDTYSKFKKIMTSQRKKLSIDRQIVKDIKNLT